MKKIFLFLFSSTIISSFISAQNVAINSDGSDPNLSAMLDVKSNNKGLLIPRMTQAQISGISSPATGLLVFQTDGNAGFYYNIGLPASPVWVNLISSVSGWQTNGNTGTNPSLDFIGTKDNQPLSFRVNNETAGKIDGPATQNLFLGYQAGQFNSSGTLNTGLGFSALRNNSTGSSNTGVGVQSLYSNTSGSRNTSHGFFSLYANTTGEDNVAAGYISLRDNTTGNFNSAFGSLSLQSNTSGFQNTAIGAFSLKTNTTGNQNTAIGFNSLNKNTTGDGNTATGISVLANNETGVFNTAAGYSSLANNISGNSNTVIGSQTAISTTTGSFNTALGRSTLMTNTTGNKNTTIGFSADVNSNNRQNATAIGANSRVDCDNCLVLGSVNGVNSATSDVKVGIGTTNPNPSAALDINSTNKGLLVPRMSILERDAVTSPATGLLIYQTDDKTGFYYNTGTPAFPNWININDANSGWSLGGNTVINQASRIGTKNDVRLEFMVNGAFAGSIDHNNTNTLFGYQVGNSGASDNVGFGYRVFTGNSGGGSNVAIGNRAQYNNLEGTGNVSLGNDALQTLGFGAFNTAIGQSADVLNDNLINATAIGAFSEVGCDDCLVLGSNNSVNPNRPNTRTGIGTSNPNISAALDITSTDKGLLIPRMTQLQRDAITSPATGLMIYQTNNSPGFYYHNGSSWTSVTSNTNNLWSLNGNTGTDLSSFIGTIENKPLVFKVNNTLSARLEGLSNSEGLRGNSSFGYNAFTSNTTGILNTAIGINSLMLNTSGNQNTAIGDGVLEQNVQGGFNTASGTAAMALNLNGNGNTASGWDALSSNLHGNLNTAFGAHTLLSNVNGSNNTALGYRADVSSANLTNATAIGAKSKVDCDNCLVLGSVNGIGSDDEPTFDVNVGIGTTNPNISAALEINSTDKGLLIPRMSQTQRDAITSPANGLMIYQTDNTPGFYYHNGSSWTSISVKANNLWSTNGNAGTNPSTNFIGTSDNQPLVFKVNNNLAGKIGESSNTSVGIGALQSVILGPPGNASGSLNTAFGNSALSGTTSGFGNTAMGVEALSSNSEGAGNTAMGYIALRDNTTGFGNTTYGEGSLQSNTTGGYNTSVGKSALWLNVTGSNNTTVGYNANVSAGNLTNATALGSNAIVNANNKVRIGNTSVTVIEGQVPFTTPSDGRYKYNVKEDVKGLDFILKLRPVTYQFDVKKMDEDMQPKGIINASYKSNTFYDEAIKMRRIGFIAQDVEKAADETGFNFSGIIKPKTEKDHYGLSYESFVVPLVKAVQEQQKQIETLKKENEDLKKIKEELEALKKIVEKLSVNK